MLIIGTRYLAGTGHSAGSYRNNRDDVSGCDGRESCGS